jgi:hypothetical protein
MEARLPDINQINRVETSGVEKKALAVRSRRTLVIIIRHWMPTWQESKGLLGFGLIAGIVLNLARYSFNGCSEHVPRRPGTLRTRRHMT